MDLYDVVTKLVGPIRPAGCSNTDRKRLKNLEAMTALVDKLLFDISDVANSKTSHEHSVKLAGEHADKFLTAIREQ